MSLDVYLNRKRYLSYDDGKTYTEDNEQVYWANITHNLGKMASEAGIYEEFWQEINRLERPESEESKSGSVELSNGLFIDYDLYWSWVDETFSHEFGTEVTGYFDPVINSAKLVDEDGKLILDITNLVK